MIGRAEYVRPSILKSDVTTTLTLSGLDGADLGQEEQEEEHLQQEEHVRYQQPGQVHKQQQTPEQGNRERQLSQSDQEEQAM